MDAPGLAINADADPGEDSLVLLRRPGVAPSRRDFADVRSDEPCDVTAAAQ
jgi:hypothetical protein